MAGKGTAIASKSMVTLEPSLEALLGFGCVLWTCRKVGESLSPWLSRSTSLRERNLGATISSICATQCHSVICVCVCAYMMYVCKFIWSRCMYVCARMWKPEVSLEYHSSGACLFVYCLFIFFKTCLFLILWVFCLGVYMCTTCMPNVPRGQRGC